TLLRTLTAQSLPLILFRGERGCSGGPFVPDAALAPEQARHASHRDVGSRPHGHAGRAPLASSSTARRCSMRIRRTSATVCGFDWSEWLRHTTHADPTPP